MRYNNNDMEDGEEDELYADATRRVKKKKGFYRHLSVYLVIGCFFFLMNMAGDPRDIWFIYPMLVWGVGLGIHYVGVFGLPGFNFNSREWEQAEIEREVRQLGGKRSSREREPLSSSSYHQEELHDDLALPPLQAEKKKIPNYRDDDFV